MERKDLWLMVVLVICLMVLSFAPLCIKARDLLELIEHVRELESRHGK